MLILNIIEQNMQPMNFNNLSHIFKLFKMPTSIVCSYFKGQYLFKEYTNIVTIYGSARVDHKHEWYKQVKDLSESLAAAGLEVMSGGGPGLMQAANEGAKAGQGASLGCCIKTENEEKKNNFLDKSMTCEYFSIRKVILTKFAKAFIITPGGYGTLDELFEILNLIITKKTPKKPIILFGTIFWQPLMLFIENSLLKNALISESDLENLIITDDSQVIIEIINNQ